MHALDRPPALCFVGSKKDAFAISSSLVISITMVDFADHIREVKLPFLGFILLLIVQKSKMCVLLVIII